MANTTINAGLKNFTPESFTPDRESLKYRRISDADFAAVMKRLGFTEAPQRGFTKEKVFTGRIARRPEVEVDVFSSVVYGKGKARDCGKDAIRVIVRDAVTGGPLAKFNRINRDGRWQTRLVTRLNDALEAVRSGDVAAALKRARCSECGGLMAVRKRRDGGEFLGCTGFRTQGCRGTANNDGSRKERKGQVDVPCLDCGSPVALREGTSRYGRPYRFYGCTNFPRCRGSRNYDEVQEALAEAANPTTNTAPVTTAVAVRATSAPW